MQVCGETMIFKNDFGFSTSISNKKQDGTYENMALSVAFRKDDLDAQRIPNKTKINIKNGFLSFYKGTNGLPKVKVIVLEYDVLGDLAEMQDDEPDWPSPDGEPDWPSPDVTNLDDDLPF